MLRSVKKVGKIWVLGFDTAKSPRFKKRAKLSDVIDDPVGRQRGQLSRRRWRGDLVILVISLVSFDAAGSTVCGN